MKHSTIFVSCYFNIYKGKEHEETEERYSLQGRFSRFKALAETGILIDLYTSHDEKAILEELLRPYPNVLVRTDLQIEDCIAYKSYNRMNDRNEISLPRNRSEKKDTLEFILLQYYKMDFVHHTKNHPLRETGEHYYYAWIDYSISYIFRDAPATLSFLKMVASSLQFPLMESDRIVVPGCWNERINDWTPSSPFLECVAWRYCGGFFIGTAHSIDRFYRYYHRYFGVFLETYYKLVWEVNFWAWLEFTLHTTTTEDPLFLWYYADHNDSMLNHLPPRFYSSSLLLNKRRFGLCSEDLITKITPLLTECDGSLSYSLSSSFSYSGSQEKENLFLPMNTSHVFFNNQHILNTRYVNYRIEESGHFRIKEGNNRIVSKNVCSLLGLPYEGGSFNPIVYSSFEMEDNEGTLGLPSKNTVACYGIEDIRLFTNEYSPEKGVQFIGSSCNYTTFDTFNSIILGDYDMDTGSLRNGKCIVPPPQSGGCEKNWTPLPPSPLTKKVYFVYKWTPIMEIGTIGEENQLNILYRYSLETSFFKGKFIKGSTAFIDAPLMGGLLGLVHICDDTVFPRQYFHLFVLLDRDTYRPLRHSAPFYFHHLGVEYCSGMMLHPNQREVICWVSLKDRDTTMIEIPLAKLPPLLYEFEYRSPIEKILYINLGKREDRRREIEGVFSTMGFPSRYYERVEAIENVEAGFIGCTQSHINAVRTAMERGLRNVLILEDDYEMTVSKEEWEATIQNLFEWKPQFNVCMITYSLTGSDIPGSMEATENPLFSRIRNANNAAGYIIQEHYYKTLLDVWENALPQLIETHQHWVYMNDQIWKTLQERDEWLCFNCMAGFQRAGFSNISNRYCDYKNNIIL